MNNKVTRMAVCLVLLACLASFANASNKDRIGTAGAQELLIPVGARTTAMGASSMIFATGAEAIYWNPAGLGHMNGSVEAMLSSMNYIADIGVIYGAVGVKAGDFGTLGFTIKSINFGNIPVTTTQFPDGTGEQYSPVYITLGATYSKVLTDRIAIGVTANLVSERIMQLSASTVAINFGIQYQNLAVQGLNLGITVKNIGPGMTFNGSNLLYNADATTGLRGTQPYAVVAAPADLPSAIEIGLGYAKKFDEKNGLTFGGTFRNNNYQDDEYNLGAEYEFNNTLFVRGGYTFAPQAGKDVAGNNVYPFDYTLGAGVHTPVGDLDLSVDYAYQHVKYFSGNNVFTLRLGF
ncbi:MAG TPA: PorV/PorQ family protein [Bacteroidota bacterium]|nr:PorV/PorQ family protein [Bacteroidota bacterium]